MFKKENKKIISFFQSKYSKDKLRVWMYFCDIIPYSI
jgi:hypothetical protein